MKFLAIFIDTFREIRDKKMVIAFGIITAMFAGTYLFAISVTKLDNGKVEVSSFAGKSAIDGVKFVEQQMVLFSQIIGGTLIFLFIIAFAFVMANLLKPGTLDLHLSKPLWRSQLLLYKFFACTLSVFVLMLVMGGTLWGILSFKAGVITFQPFLSIVMIPLVFAIAFSLIVFCCVFTRGAGAGISAYLVYAYLLETVLQSREFIKHQIGNDTFSFIMDMSYHILPKIRECMAIFIQLNVSNVDWYPLTSSLIFMVVTLAISCVIFESKDY
ncbi:ABC transporter permease subunit [Candidatus Uabimicrobium amorphum]|uniref:Uncharacterized protein n=1 Tax=Uabimicrobium amorphum TaxID=2596890 RepID=A0A5S9F3M6_UABAM|nr:ABC transporter permease subunit [Candidatus Uabimicrobium amorphum]BBM84303.1 hypothetical protein UABAM_02660 [Candidatus Uabimicrobium amorphum]